MAKQLSNSFRSKKKDIATKKSGIAKLNSSKNKVVGLPAKLSLIGKKGGARDAGATSDDSGKSENKNKLLIKLKNLIKNPIFKTAAAALGLALVAGLLLQISGSATPKVYTEGYYFKDLNIDLDPLKTDSTGSNQILLDLLYLRLTRQNHQGDFESSIVEIAGSEDAKTYTLKLKQGLKWSDDKPVSADDLEFSLAQFIAKESEPAFKGAKVKKQEGSIILSLASPDAELAHHLNNIFLAPKHNYIINQGVVEQTDQEISGGAYLYRGLQLIEGGLQIRLSANPNYFNSAKVTNQNLNLRFLSDKQKLINDFNGGRISATPQLNRLDIKSDKAKIYTYRTPAQTFAFFNNTTLGGAGLRKALAYSINQNEVASAAFQPEASSLFNQYQLTNFQEGGTLGFNKDEALKLFGESGYQKNGDILAKKDGGEQLKLKLVAADDPVNTKTAEVVTRQLKEMGIGTETKLVEAKELKDQYFSSHNYDILIYGIDMGIKPDLKTYWSSNQPNKDLNFSSLNDPKLEGLMISYANAKNADQKNQALLKFSQGWTALAPAKPLYGQNVSLISRYNIGSSGEGLVVDTQDYLAKIPYFKLGSR